MYTTHKLIGHVMISSRRCGRLRGVGRVRSAFLRTLFFLSRWRTLNFCAARTGRVGEVRCAIATSAAFQERGGSDIRRAKVCCRRARQARTDRLAVRAANSRSRARRATTRRRRVLAGGVVPSPLSPTGRHKPSPCRWCKGAESRADAHFFRPAGLCQLSAITGGLRPRLTARCSGLFALRALW